MKVVWVNPGFLDYRIPVYTHLNSLLDGKFHVIYSTSFTPERVHRKITDKLGYNAIPLHFEKCASFGNSSSDFSNKSYRIPFPQTLIKHLNKINPDVLIGEGFFQWTPFALSYSLLNRKKTFICYERTKYTERNCNKLREMYRRLVGKLASGFIVNGSLSKEYCIDNLGISPRLIATRCMSAGDYKDISVLSEKAPPKIVRFLFVGKLVERKGMRPFLEVIGKNSTELKDSVLFNIVGSGPEYSDLVSFCDKEKLNFVNFVGDVDHNKISQQYSKNDVFFLPTLEDNWSLVVPEAMAHGLPIATTPYNGCYPELLNHKSNGYLFDIVDENSVMEMVRFFILNKDRLSHMGHLSYKIQQEYSSEKVAKRIFEHITKA